MWTIIGSIAACIGAIWVSVLVLQEWLKQRQEIRERKERLEEYEQSTTTDEPK